MRVASIILVSAALAACSTPAPDHPRFIVSAQPFVLFPNGPKMCVAVDPANPHGAWWWEPGKTGCASRATGPTVFPADRADVRTAADTTDVQFEIRLQSGNAAPIKLTIAHDTIRREPSGEQVPIEHRRDLDIPEMCCFAKSGQ